MEKGSKRKSGVLLHVTSLPSPYGIGDLGQGAYRFIDLLSEAGQSLWQIVPLNPTSTFTGNNPYSSFSAFAGNILLISPDILLKEGLLGEEDLRSRPSFPKEKCDYESVTVYKEKLLDLAYGRFKAKGKKDREYERFCSDNKSWLEDFVLFLSIKKRFNGSAWNKWPEELRDRKPESLGAVRREQADEIEKERFLQFLFFKQWSSLKKYCNDKGIQIIGDIPIYVSYDSVDVWKDPHIFKLDKKKRPVFISGVPPDYFSATGQLWGNPVYEWRELKKSGYKWWIDRMAHNFSLVDILRVDHFRGFVAFWEVPAGEATAINGRWIKAPVEDFFSALLKAFPDLPIIAEDLGIITDDVKEVMRHFGFPGMRVLLFAFGNDDPEHPYLPHNFVRNCIAYTGTHDNNTTRGWFEKEATPEEKERVAAYVGQEVSLDSVHWELVHLAMMSVADTVVFPMQDILGLGGEARMNTPSTAKGNYLWRLSPDKMDSPCWKTLADMTRIYGRAPKK